MISWTLGMSLMVLPVCNIYLVIITHTHKYIHTQLPHMYTCIHTHTNKHTHKRMHIHICTLAQIHTRTHARTHTHTHTHAHEHTYTTKGHSYGVSGCKGVTKTRRLHVTVKQVECKLTSLKRAKCYIIYYGFSICDTLSLQI